ncbi:putative bifunctional diguanylate cyclase/phosphodiesterase [Amphritea sp.]|uniref:putative bifunctional diguanylate cyclase/phosphodiesterase n=1 Tax=Amphritea sp. TaxID=1872502 RepID=UPI003D12CF1E
MNSPMRLLLIDDDEVDRMAVIRSLKKSTTNVSEVITAATASEGLELASREHFDAILLDYRLPDQDGLAVLQTLRSGNFESGTVVMLSRHEDETLAERCLEAGAQDFLLKDEVNGRRLYRAVRQARQRYQIQDALNRSREQLLELSVHDPLTGLLNRRGFDNAMKKEFARAQRSDSNELALLLLDLDDFKNINDIHGHATGDLLLIEVAQRLNTVIRDNDYLCRLGGDEFVIVMTLLEHEEQAVELANRIFSILQQPFKIGTTTADQSVTASIGIAMLDGSDDHTEDLLKCADIAMYHAKKTGRNQCQYYSSALQQLVQSRIRIKNDLSVALDRNEFRVFYQAQFNASDRSLGGAEALLRWQHPELGLLSPDVFMPIAEETGLIVSIGNWVLHEGCRQLKEWQLNYPELAGNMTIAINLSPVQIKQHSLSTAVHNALDKHALDANCLELEITESAMIEDTTATAEILSAISHHGITFSLDDFGTGYSSLVHLKQFPISVLKIDKGFVSSIENDDKNKRLLIAIIAFAKALEMCVVAEGVETVEQAEICTEYSCDLLQGYYFARPLPADQFEATFFSS